MAKPLEQVGRIAFRQEGENWNAYYAQPQSMDQAIYLGTLSMHLARSPKHKQAFMDLMCEGMSDFMQGALGFRPEWHSPHSAPEHERSGNA